MHSKAAAAMTMLLWAGTTYAQTGTSWPASSERVTVSVEPLLAWFKASPTPAPIITTGLVGQPGTSTLLGGGEVDTNPNGGVRATLTYRWTPHWTLEASGFTIPSRSTSSEVASSGLPGSIDLLLPYFDARTNRENATEISFAPSYGGSARGEFDNSMAGAEASVSWPLGSAAAPNLEAMAGLRWLRLKERYAISTSSPVNPPEPPDIWMTRDAFGTRNDFYGAQFGLRTRYDVDRWFAGAHLALGVGAMRQRVDVEGSLVTNDFTALGATETFAGGYFALPTNMGAHARTVFAFVPELRLRLGYRLTPAASLFAGYSLLYANNVVRPGEQINRTINPTQSVAYAGEPRTVANGPAEPSFSFRKSDFAAHALSIGVDVRF